MLFTYALVPTKFYGVSWQHVGWPMLPFALGNFDGPLLLGQLFDSSLRRTMIIATYALAGILMAAVGVTFARGRLDATQQKIA